jgi:hypothetical protein
MIIGVMCIERIRVAFVAVVTTSLSRSENSSRTESVDARIVRHRGAMRNPRVPQMRLKAVTVSAPKVPGQNILFVRLTRRYIPIVRVTGVR